MLDRIVEVFCEVDDFCQAFLPQWEASLLGPGGPAPRGPQPGLSTSEIITLLLVLVWCMDAAVARADDIG